MSNHSTYKAGELHKIHILSSILCLLPFDTHFRVLYVEYVFQIMVNFQSAMIQLKDIRDVKVTLHLMLPLLNCQTEMLNFGPVKFLAISEMI